MIYTDKTKKAMKLCFAAHKDQVDKSGIPYVFHPFHVAEQMTNETATVVALLHDVVEDTEYTLDDITAQGFGKEVVEALALMTHDKSVPYLDYVAKIKTNPIAKEVKLADLAHNSDTSRLDEIDEKTIERLKKYRKAINLLQAKAVIHITDKPDKNKVTSVKTEDGTLVYYAFVDKIDYHFSDLPRWAQALPEKSFLIINPDVINGCVIVPETLSTVKDIRTSLFWDSWYEMGREDK